MSKVNAGVMEHPSMEITVPIVSVNMGPVLLNQPHHLVTVTMGVVVLHQVNVLAFYAIYATLSMRNVKVIANQSFLVPVVREYVMRILHTITTIAFVIRCVHRVGHVVHVTDTELAMMVSVSAMTTGSTMAVISV